MADLERRLYHQTVAANPWPAPPVPQRADIAAAAALLKSTLPPTPLVKSEHLSARFGRTVLLKLEMLSPVRSFKHRGALVAVDAIARSGQAHSIVTASTGNHGQGVAFAGGRLGLPVVVISPENTATEKLAAMRKLGADVRVMGTNLDEAQQIGESMASNAVVYLEDGESPELMAGAATVTIEILESAPDVAAIIYPIGGGNLIAGALLAVRYFDGATPAIIGAQSAAASAVTTSWLEGSLQSAPCATFAGGLATTRPGELALSVMASDLGTIALVTDDDLRHAMAVCMHSAGISIEGASAATIAALERYGDEIDHDAVVLVFTGNWCSHQERLDTVERLAAL